MYVLITAAAPVLTPGAVTSLTRKQSGTKQRFDTVQQLKFIAIMVLIIVVVIVVVVNKALTSCRIQYKGTNYQGTKIHRVRNYFGTVAPVQLTQPCLVLCVCVHAQWTVCPLCNIVYVHIVPSTSSPRIGASRTRYLSTKFSNVEQHRPVAPLSINERTTPVSPAIDLLSIVNLTDAYTRSLFHSHAPHPSFTLSSRASS